MSDNVLKIIPSSPTYVPSSTAIKKCTVRLHEVFPAAEKIRHEIDTLPKFVDAGSNLQQILCPQCNSPLEVEWWRQAMDIAHKNGNQDLSLTVPCCNSITSLNDLKYDWEVGFAQFSLEIVNPRVRLEFDDLQELENILQTKLKIIWAHY